MIRMDRYKLIKSIYIFIDIYFFWLAIFIASWLRQSTLTFEVHIFNLFFDPINPYRFLFLFWALVIIFLNNAYGLYQTRREIFETVEIWQVIKAVLLSSLLVIVAIYVAKIQDFPRLILFFVVILTSVFFSLWRIFKRMFVEYLVSQGYNNFNALIVGAGRVGRALAQEISKRPGLGLKVVGYLDDFKENDPNVNGPRTLGKISDFMTIARNEFVDEIFVTCHHDGQIILQLLEQAKELGVAVRVIPHGFELMSGECVRYNIGFIPVLEYCNGQLRRRHVGKRFFDIITALFAVVFLLPVFLILGIFIKLEAPGPIFYLSSRYGRSGHVFRMFKFRSMVHNADQMVEQFLGQNEADGPIFKIKNDPRVTRIGRFLRKYSLDELPQLFNVLKGEMSLVGPRPLPIDQVQKEDFRQLKRLEVKPGITGLWQIRGRSDISFSRLVKWDIWYINNWSFWLDLNILWQTLPVVIKGRGAY